MLDGVLIFILVGTGVLDARRGTMLASFDLAGAILGFKAATFWYSGFGIFLNKSMGFSPVSATIAAALLIFLLVFFVFFGIGYVAHGLTLLTLGDPFESIVGSIFGVFASGTFLRLVLVLVMSFTQNPQGACTSGICDAVKDSYVGYEIYTLTTYNDIMKMLDPLRNPGEIYF